MSYKEQMDQARHKGKAKAITVDIHTWTEEGQELIGMVNQIKPFVSGKFDTDVLQYTLETDDGLKSTVLGAATDKQLEGRIKEGSIVCITFHGKKEIGQGRNVNRFEVIAL